MGVSFALPRHAEHHGDGQGLPAPCPGVQGTVRCRRQELFEEVSVAENEGGERKIKVVDRRWFDESGELRRERPAPSAAEKPAQPSAAAPQEEKAGEERAEPRKDVPREGAPTGGTGPGEASGGGGVSWPSSVNFMQMVDFLAQQAMLLLSGAQGVPASPDQARIFIDFLGILEDRTRGNLSPEEARFLADVLFQLRALYVQQTGR